MNIPFKKRLLSLAVLAVFPVVAWCDDGIRLDTNPPLAVQSVDQTSEWGIEFKPVPDLLRMHCPPLSHGMGLLVCRVDNGGPAYGELGLRTNDILLSVEGVPVRKTSDLPSEVGRQAVVLRRGQVRQLHNQEGASPLPFSKIPLMNGFPNHSGFGPMPDGGVSASAYSSGNESVSVSQNGDQILLEMSLPGLHPDLIRYRGTRQQIEQQVKGSTLSPAAQARVLSAIE